MLKVKCDGEISKETLDKTNVDFKLALFGGILLE